MFLPNDQAEAWRKMSHAAWHKWKDEWDAAPNMPWVDFIVQMIQTSNQGSQSSPQQPTTKE